MNEANKAPRRLTVRSNTHPYQEPISDAAVLLASLREDLSGISLSNVDPDKCHVLIVKRPTERPVRIAIWVPRSPSEMSGLLHLSYGYQLISGKAFEWVSVLDLDKGGAMTPLPKEAPNSESRIGAVVIRRTSFGVEPRRPGSRAGFGVTFQLGTAPGKIHLQHVQVVDGTGKSLLSSQQTWAALLGAAANVVESGSPSTKDSSLAKGSSGDQQQSRTRVKDDQLQGAVEFFFEEMKLVSERLEAVEKKLEEVLCLAKSRVSEPSEVATLVTLHEKTALAWRNERKKYQQRIDALREDLDEALAKAGKGRSSQ